MGKLKLECNYCGKDVYKYPSQATTQNVYCNRECWKSKNKENSTTVNCDNCGKEFTRRNSTFAYKHHFCTTNCHHEHMSKNNTGENNHWFGKQHSEESIVKMRKSIKALDRKGENSPLYERYPVQCDQCDKIVYKTKYLIERSKNQFCSVSCHGLWISENLIGESHPSWNPDISEEDRIKGRKYPEYAQFVKDVMQRDWYTCDICKCKGKELNVHHLNGYGWDIENRTNPDNGITLCVKCHTNFHSAYGFGDNTKEQYEEYKSRIENQSESFSIS